MKIDWQKEYFMKGNNYGLTSFVGGIMQIIFGFNFGLIPLAIFIVTVTSIVLCFIKEKNNRKRRVLNVFGIILLSSAIILYYFFGFYGIVGSWVLPKYVSLAI